MENNIIAEKSFLFAIRIVNLQKYLVNQKREYVLSKQILRCGTSIGANVSEGIRGQSRADFAAKMAIALKEASETSYWLKLLCATDYITQEQCDSLLADLSELLALLTSICKTATKAE